MIEVGLQGSSCAKKSSGFSGRFAEITLLFRQQLQVDRLCSSDGAFVVVLVAETDGEVEGASVVVVVLVDGAEAGIALPVLALHWCFDMQVGQNQWPHAPHVCRYPGLCPHRQHFLPLFFVTGNAAVFASCSGCRLCVGAWKLVHGGETQGSPGKLNWTRLNTVSLR